MAYYNCTGTRWIQWCMPLPMLSLLSSTKSRNFSNFHRAYVQSCCSPKQLISNLCNWSNNSACFMCLRKCAVILSFSVWVLERVTSHWTICIKDITHWPNSFCFDEQQTDTHNEEEVNTGWINGETIGANLFAMFIIRFISICASARQLYILPILWTTSWINCLHFYTYLSSCIWIVFIIGGA